MASLSEAARALGEVDVGVLSQGTTRGLKPMDCSGGTQNGLASRLVHPSRIELWDLLVHGWASQLLGTYQTPNSPQPLITCTEATWRGGGEDTPSLGAQGSLPDSVLQRQRTRMFPPH